MIPKNVYRLNEYLISEFADGRLWWDAHFGFGMQTGGPCYIYGNILMMGARCKEENGFLKTEFLDEMRNFPLWNRTRYYCHASALLDTATGRVIREDSLRQLVPLPCEPSAIITGKPETFRLGQYQISITTDGDVSWKSGGGMNRIVGGPVLIESNVLFLGPRNVEDLQQNKREFLQTLRAFPKWDRTPFWCRSLMLKPVLIDGKSPLPLSPNINERVSQHKKQPVKSHRSEYAIQAWSKMAEYCSDWVEEVKARWPKRGWLKRKKNREISNKID